MELLFQICRSLAEEAPAEIQVIPAGQHVTDKGDFVLDAESAAAVLAAFEAKQNDLVIDYEHQSLAGKEAPAAGWIKKLVDKGAEGIWATVEWTVRAAEYLKQREYRYLSPVFLVRQADRKVVELVNAGLTNMPAIDGMVPLVNKSLEGRFSDRQEGGMKKVFSVLGLAEGANEDQAVAAIEQLKAKPVVVANKTVLETLGLQEGASESEVTGTILAMKQSHDQLGGLAQEVKTLKIRLAERDANDLVAEAMKQGKVTPATEDWARKYAAADPEGFRTFIAKAPVVIHTGQIAGDPKPGSESGLEETQLAVNKQLGLDTETFKKYVA